MIVGTDFLGHFKTKMLRVMLDEKAPLYVLSLWAYCQNQHTDEVPADAVELAAICDYVGDPLILKDALLRARFLENGVGEGRLRVHGWMEKNAQLIQKWNAGKTGKRPSSDRVATDRRPASPTPLEAIASKTPPLNERPIGDRVATDRRPIGDQTPDKIRLDKNSLCVSLSLEEGKNNKSQITDDRLQVIDQVGNPDEAHRILVSTPELRGLTWEQDLTARRFVKPMDWVDIAPRIVGKAVLMGFIDHPGSWLEAQYRKFEKGDIAKRDADEIHSERQFRKGEMS